MDGVVAAGTVSTVDVGGALVSTSPISDPRHQTAFNLSIQAVSPGLFDAARAELRSGRALDAGHSQRADRVAVLGPAAAQRLGVEGVEQLSAIRIGDDVYLVTDNTSVSTVAKSNTLLTAIDAAIGQVSNFRARLGAAQNQMESAVNSLGVAVENLSASESRIRDADIASVSSELVTRQIMQQAGVAVLAQSNTAPQSALALIT